MNFLKFLVLIILFISMGCQKSILPMNESLRDGERINKSDPLCTGKAHENYFIGFGVEHVYEGKITENKPVSIVLSCDHRKFSISGTVSQLINGEDFKYPGGETVGELADISSGELVVHVSEDYNFDGYNDLSTIISNGSGNSAIDTYVIFLYNENENKFLFSKDLMGKENLTINPKTKIISEIYSCGLDKNDQYIIRSTEYKWQQNKLKRVGKVASCP